jgi:hypothetical protein
VVGPEREESRQLLKHWKRFRGAKRLPDRDDIHLDELAEFMPYLFLVDIETADRFIIKLVGISVQERFRGLDLTGLNLLELSAPAFRERLQARVRMTFEFGYAACTHTAVPAEDGRLKRTENLMLPVENSAGGCRQIFGAIFYTDGADDAAHHQATSEGMQFLDECFIDLGSGYASIIDASELPHSVFPSKQDRAE